ncbi:MAG TPA: toll/interleukin-1 receptor domain-containing protein [Xanthobacteraceae bacterium]|nr:toll/interleukin-1 receptor domain-containing protein [Xanthobacteraceae bacterium]
MSSLADLSDLVGFFSYSREDDQGSRGALSALRDAIQSELSAQLGRSHTDFRVWQDKAAIPLGTLWENQISDAINQSAFFVPIVTPRAMRSQHCTFEFESFLAREKELGRDDLVFPILYIPVPALEDEKLWRQDPVLKIVGTRQYLDWRDLRHLEHNSPEVRQKVERFCRNISSALRKPWVSLEERRREAEAQAQQRVEEEQRRKAAEIEAARLAEEERRSREAEAVRRAQEQERTQADRAFTAAKRANNIAAVDSFLACYPKSHLVSEAQTLLATFRARDEAHRRAMTSNDPVVLNAFRDAYKKGADVDQIRKRLQLFEAPQQRRSLRQAIFITTALAVILGGAGIVWLEMRPGSNVPQVSVAAMPSKPAENAAGPATKTKVVDTAPSVAPPAPIVAPAAPIPPEVKVDIPVKPAPTPAVVPGPSPDDVAWLLLKDTTDIVALERFIAQFPDSPERAIAEQRIASLSTPRPQPVVVNAPDPHDLTRLLQVELTRVGCFKGTVNGDFDDATKVALARFIKLTSLSVPDDVSSDAINAIRGINKRVCPLVCPHGERAESDVCVANAPPPPPPPPKHTAKVAPALAGKPTPQANPSAAPSPDTGCIGAAMNARASNLHRLPGGECGY